MRLVVGLLAMLVAGCAGVGASTPDPSARPKLGVSNGTTLTVTIFVNGDRLADFPPGAPGPSLDVATMPSLPWTVEARSPSGRVLTSMVVKPGDVAISSFPGGDALSGDDGRVDLSCGSLRIWAGDIGPSGSAPASPAGSPGDCAP
jgi:hypothetical protein